MPHLGAQVVATASPRNHDHVSALGAADVLDYHEGPVSELLADHGGPVDAVLDLVGGTALDDAPAQVKDPRRIASVIDPVTVGELGGRYVFVRPERGHLDELRRLVDTGALRVDLARTFDLADIAAAHRASEEGHTRGKIVVRT